MDDVFGNPPAQQEREPQGEPQAEQTTQQGAVHSSEDAAPPAADTDKHVPLAALEAERKGRQDWKEKALRYEGELKAAREQARAASRAGEPPQEIDPLQAMQARIENMTLNASEAMARRAYGSEVVDKAFERFQQALAQDPTLRQRALAQADPWDWVVREGKRLAFLDEVGDDPAAYREKLRAELQAEIQSKPKPALPQSLAGARSVGARNASGFTGPPPFESLFPN